MTKLQMSDARALGYVLALLLSTAGAPVPQIGDWMTLWVGVVIFLLTSSQDLQMARICNFVRKERVMGS